MDWDAVNRTINRLRLPGVGVVEPVLEYDAQGEESVKTLLAVHDIPTALIRPRQSESCVIEFRS
jgi:hypothetical protein